MQCTGNGMIQRLYKLEDKLGTGPVNTARFLGYSYSTYAQYKSGRRELTPYLLAHVNALLAMPDELLKNVFEEAINGHS
jgi:transcriptional regulator with XRE-family HTH domain